MGLLSKLFGGKKQEIAAEEAAIDCPHGVLVARWETVQDMGIEEKATRYMCESCHQEFTPDVAREMRETLRDRIYTQALADGASAEEAGAKAEATVIAGSLEGFGDNAIEELENAAKDEEDKKD